MKRYYINYFCCALSLFAALVCSMTHQLGFLLLNFFFAVWNWYTAEWLRTKDNQNEENDNRESNDSDSTSTTEDDTEDQE